MECTSNCLSGKVVGSVTLTALIERFSVSTRQSIISLQDFIVKSILFHQKEIKYETIG